MSYVYQNPESGGIGDDHTGALEYKHVWVVKHDGLLFASGWHISADEYTKFVVDEAIARFHTEGLEATLEHYNSAESVDAQWYVLITTPEGEVLGHYNAEDFAVHLQHMLDDGSFRATEEGVWVNHEDVNPTTGEVEDKHFWLVERDGLIFGTQATNVNGGDRTSAAKKPASRQRTNIASRYSIPRSVSASL